LRRSPVTKLPSGRCAAASAACCRSAWRAGEAAAIETAARVEVWKRATSLGGVESLVEHRASVEGVGTPAPADLLRMSVGIEDVGDLIADLEQALR
jgi:cystathionine gamma-synthase